ncbi:hypothetical protein ACJVDH_04760 [Pedobacter sp. AW1-32]|uniref:hypothetical protein n=1 Tax=Pedobacter sp. AW1-32 TaxID=3383026 RepID=UPI003FF063B2
MNLKTTSLNHQDIGQIDMYVRIYDDMKRASDGNPPRLAIVLRKRRKNRQIFGIE